MNAPDEPAAIAAAVRARMNSMRRRCSSRWISQKLTTISTATAISAVPASSSSRLTGAMSITSVAISHVIPVATIAARDAEPERPLVVGRAAGGERPEQDRDQQHRLDALAEEDREREAERERRRRDALASRAHGRRRAARRADRRARAHVVDGRAVADPVAHLGERELGVEHEVRVAQAQRDLDELEVVEVGGARQA